MGWRAFVINWLGRRHVLDMRLDQEYLRSQAVNSPACITEITDSL